MTGSVFLDSFSGEIVSLKRGHRSNANILAVLEQYPRISTWDMVENIWLRNAIENLLCKQFIRTVPDSYPWHRYVVTDAGKMVMEAV